MFYNSSNNDICTTVTQEKTVVENRGMPKIIAIVSNEQAISLPLKWVLQRCGSSLQPLVVGCCFPRDFGAFAASLRLNVVKLVGY